MAKASETSTIGSDPTIRDLTDREAIRDLANRYVHCVWRRDVEGVVDLFADDAVLETPDFPPVTGREALVEAYRQVFGAESDLQPFVHNHVIELDGDTAQGSCYLDLRMISAEGRRLLGSGYYDDDYVRVDGAWKFSRRKVTMTAFWPVPRARSVEGEPPAPNLLRAGDGDQGD